MKEQLLLSSLIKSIPKYTIIEPGGRQIKSKRKVIAREFEDLTRQVFIHTVTYVNYPVFN